MGTTAIKACIAGTGSALPKKILTNKEFETIVDTNDEWIVRRTGIEARRISSNEAEESTSGLATLAGLQAVNMAGISPKELDMIVVGTSDS